MRKITLTLLDAVLASLAGMTILGYMDVGLRIFVAVSLGIRVYWWVKGQRSKIRLEKIQYEIEQQKLKRLNQETQDSDEDNRPG